jgi:hypothetical protein
MGATIIVKNNATVTSGSIVMKRKLQNTATSFGPYTVIAQYLVYQESMGGFTA